MDERVELGAWSVVTEIYQFDSKGASARNKTIRSRNQSIRDSLTLCMIYWKERIAEFLPTPYHVIIVS